MIRARCFPAAASFTVHVVFQRRRLFRTRTVWVNILRVIFRHSIPQSRTCTRCFGVLFARRVSRLPSGLLQVQDWGKLHHEHSRLWWRRGLQGRFGRAELRYAIVFTPQSCYDEVIGHICSLSEFRWQRRPTLRMGSGDLGGQNYLSGEFVLEKKTIGEKRKR